MPFAVFFVIFVILVVVVRSSQAGGGGRQALLAQGLEARGLILQANASATDTTYFGQRFELRRLLLDIEVPGQAPYELSVTPMIPRSCEALPGAALDLRVDRANPQNIAVVGPAGSSGWLNVAAAIPGQTWAGPQRGANVLPKGCGTLVVVLIGMSLALASILTFINDARKSSAHSAPSPSHAATSRPAHMPPSRGGSRPSTRGK